MTPTIMNQSAKYPVGLLVPSTSAHHEQAAEPARHHDFGVGEVDEPEHAVDEGVAEGDEGVEEAVGEAPDDERDPEVVVLYEPRTVHAFRPPPSTLGSRLVS